MSYGLIVAQNVVKDDILFCLKWQNMVVLDCYNIYLDWLIDWFNYQVNNISVISGVLLEKKNKIY